MTDLDQLARAMKDHEKRLNRIEAWMEARLDAVRKAKAELTVIDNDYRLLVNDPSRQMSRQFCECGKDKLLCRDPDCPSHKPDPMGR